MKYLECDLGKVALQRLCRGDCSKADDKDVVQKRLQERVCLTGKKKQILCPYCTETCSTNWNLKIHIQRKHSGKAKPATPGSYATGPQFSSSDVTSNMPATTNDRHYYHPDNNNGFYITVKLLFSSI